MKYLDENFSNVKNAFFLHHPGRLYTVGKISTRNIHVCYDKDKQKIVHFLCYNGKKKRHGSVF